MSAIAGICNLDGRPVDRARLQRMTDAIAYRGPDGLGCWIDGATGLGHAMLHTTAESLREVQPLSDVSCALCLSFAGRVDNRDELRAALRSKGLALIADTDAELVLRAYQCWGEDCPQRILGDFAFAVWDGRKRTLFCARDVLGVRPFYYYADQRSFIFGSELQQLFKGADIPCEPNEGMIGEYLADSITSREETLYQGILRLPPAHCLRVQDGKLQTRRYWDADPARAIRYRNDAEYAEHFLEIFTEAVCCRLRSQGGVGSDLSGGLDSSSVVSLIMSLQHEGKIANRDIEAYSLVFPGLACDESGYIEDVVRKSGVKVNYLRSYEPDASCHEAYVRQHRDFPAYPGSYMWNAIRYLARERNIRVMLTGAGGDDWLSGSDIGYAELLHRFKILQLFRHARRDAQPPGNGDTIATLLFELRSDYLHLLSPKALLLVRWALRRKGVPNWINPQFARRIHLRERLQRKPDLHQFSGNTQRDQYRWLNSGYLVHSLEYDDRSAAESNFEARHPFHDRRIIEFCLALPQEQLWRKDQLKYLLRQTMRALLPESVVQRLSKAEFSHAWARAFLAQGGVSLLDSLGIYSKDWLVPGQVRATYRRMLELYAQGNEEYSDYTHQPWRVYGIDLWYKMFLLDRA
ncbi:MAG: asparagine synthase (glutamine-hydrolyzing) [Burkholderiales bacterium]|nr:asparagine synthase (glutamine-hydrolyzing) [Burkholderiales bacterium]